MQMEFQLHNATEWQSKISQLVVTLKTIQRGFQQWRGLILTIKTRGKNSNYKILRETIFSFIITSIFTVG